MSAKKFYDIAPIKNFGVSSWYFFYVFLNKNFSVNAKSLTESCVGELTLTRGLVLVASYWAIKMLRLRFLFAEFVVELGAVSNGWRAFLSVDCALLCATISFITDVGCSNFLSPKNFEKPLV